MTSSIPRTKISFRNGSARTCPLLGLLSDAETSFNYPHPSNVCYAVDPATPVRVEHQRARCLSAGYKTCPLHRSYQGSGDPAGLDRAEVGKILDLDPKVQAIRYLLAALGLVLLAAVAVLLAGIRPLSSIRLPADWGSSLLPPARPSLIAPAQVNDSWLPQVNAGGVVGGPVTPSPTVFTPLIGTSSSLVVVQPTGTVEPSPTAQPSEPAGSQAAPTEATSEEPSPEPVECGPPAGWVLYIVQPGDSLYRLSVSTGASMDAIREANCLVVGAVIYTGQQLYLPRLPAATQPPTASSTPFPTVSASPTTQPSPTVTWTASSTPPLTLSPTPPSPTATATPLPPSATPGPTITSPPPASPTVAPVIPTFEPTTENGGA